jgi:acylphosphatase
VERREGRLTRRYLVRGRVQAVGFRDFTQRVARRLEVTGWVRNGPDGRTVEAVATGMPVAIEAFERGIRQGPPGAVVTEFTAEDYPTVDVDTFEIRF